MIIRHRESWMESENRVTPEDLYLARRQFMKGAVGATLIAAAGVPAFAAPKDRTITPSSVTPDSSKDGQMMKKELTSFEAVTGYNNYYEFGTSKSDPAAYASALKTDPWFITVSGHAEKTGRFALEDLIDFSKLQERIYRLRCVEAWSMVIPWIGVPLRDVLTALKPTSDARYVAFETVARRGEMRGLRWPVLDWPYREGLRLDEAMNPLPLLAVGLYGKTLLGQNGAPVRLVVPWKYGFKSIKSIVHIRFMDKQPKTSWAMSAPREYGFYSNVNPGVDHPRWSQKTERRIGEFGRRDTEIFNGYGSVVADLYKGMDLRDHY